MWPDVAALMVAHLRGRASNLAPAVQDALTALWLACPADHIASEFKNVAAMPENRIIPQVAGGFGSSLWVPIAEANVELRCYGNSGYEAARVDRLARAVLLPLDRTSGGWQAIGGTMLAIVGATAPIPGADGDGLWPFRLSTYTLKIMETATA